MIVPGAGNDRMDPGFDTRGTSPGVRVVPDSVSYADAPAAAVVDLRTSPVAVGADGSDSIGLAPGAPLRFVGTPFADVISGTEHDDELLGRGGDDQIRGNAGDDTITADASAAPGNDILDGGAGNDSLSGSLGYDTLKGGSGGDTLTNTSINKTFILGGGGSDVVSFVVPSEPGFKVIGNMGADKLRMLPYPNPALRPTLRIDQRKGRTTVSRLVPVTVAGKVQSFVEVSLPASTTSIYKGTAKGGGRRRPPGLRGGDQGPWRRGRADRLQPSRTR